jgi:hypothetical protein
MSTDAVTLAAIADAGALLDVLADIAATIDFSASVVANTSSTGAVTIANVAGLSILADIATVQGNLAQLVAVPADLAAAIVGLVQEFQGTGVDFRAIAAATITWASSIPAAGLGYAQIIANRTAMANLLAFQGLIEAVRAATTATYDSQDTALAMRDDLADRLDTAIMTTASRPLRAALDALRVAMVTDINTRAASLDSLAVFTPARVLPALVLAHMLYDDPTMAADICARNAVAHPGFVPAVQLTVLAP